MSNNPIKRCILTEGISEDDEELQKYLEEVVKKVDDVEGDEKEDHIREQKQLVNNEFFVISAISLMCFGCLKLSFVDMLLIISLILLIVTILSNNKKEQDE